MSPQSLVDGLFMAHRLCDGRAVKANDQSHREATARRWGARSTTDDWSPDQCGRCAYWVPLAGRWGLDWGACSNQQSPHDGKVTSEPERCHAFLEGGDRWERTVSSAR